MSKNAEKWTAILLGKSPTKPINFNMLCHHNLKQFKQNYIMVLVTSYRVYQHSGINTHHAGSRWHDLNLTDFSRLANNLDQTTIALQKTRGFPNFLPPNQFKLCPEKSRLVQTSVPKCISKDDEDRKEYYHQRIGIFLQRYMR